MTPREAARGHLEVVARDAAKRATAGVLIVLSVAILALPYEEPGFLVPGLPGSTHAMKAMGAGAG